MSPPLRILIGLKVMNLDQRQYLRKCAPPLPWPNINLNLLLVDCYWVRGGVGAQLSNTNLQRQSAKSVEILKYCKIIMLHGNNSKLFSSWSSMNTSEKDDSLPIYLSYLSPRCHIVYTPQYPGPPLLSDTQTNRKPASKKVFPRGG